MGSSLCTQGLDIHEVFKVLRKDRGCVSKVTSTMHLGQMPRSCRSCQAISSPITFSSLTTVCDVVIAALPICVSLYWWSEVGRPGVKGCLGYGPVKAQSHSQGKSKVTLERSLVRQEEAELGLNLQALCAQHTTSVCLPPQLVSCICTDHICQSQSPHHLN